MRHRDRIVSNLEAQYKAVFDEANEAGDASRMSRLDFEFQRDQLIFEILLDIRDALVTSPLPDEPKGSLLDKAEQLRRITRLR